MDKSPPRNFPYFNDCIETIRNTIQPGTLAIQLTANILISDHFLIALLGNTGPILAKYLRGNT